MKRDLFKKQLEIISYTEKEYNELEKNANFLIKELKHRGVKAYIGGSFAKKTVVKKKNLQDIDIFVVFNSETETKKLKNILKDIKLPMKEIHGSRDYFDILLPDVILEVIPVVKLKDPANINNITDMSLSHVKYITQKTQKNPGILDEIRLAKSFVAASGCYGAESYIRGFSGYSLELLVIYYGSFLKFLKRIGKDKIVDIERYFKNKNIVMRELNASKLDSPIILIDPTYKYRNATAGLSQKTLDKFLKYKNSFLEKPSIDFFKQKDLDIIELRKRAAEQNAKYIQLEFSSEKQEGDIAGSKMRKFFDFICEELERNEQMIIENHFSYSGSGHLSRGFILLKYKEKVKIVGPNISMEENFELFKNAHKKEKVYIENNSLCYDKIVDIEKILAKTKEIEKDMGVKLNRFIVE